MFWDGQRWIDERAPVAPPPPRRRMRDWLATGVMVVGISALAVPFVATSAATNSADRLVSSWSGSFEIRVFQESSVLATYEGSWEELRNDQFLGATAVASVEPRAVAGFTFIGSGVAWVGPKGPLYGKAAVYIDGEYIRTVDAVASALSPRATLFSATFANVAQRTLTIRPLSTVGRPAVAVDAFVVRGPRLNAKTAANPAPPADPTPAPAPVAAPPAATPVPSSAPAPVPSAQPTAAPTAAPTPTPVATAIPTAIPTATPVPTAAPTRTPTPTSYPAPTPTATPTPTPTPTPSSTVRVTSIAALLTALADEAVTEIVVANGTYRVSGSAYRRADSLWINGRYARTRPVLVRAETTGGVTFDGGGATYFGGIMFADGASNQTWQGFVFANGTPTQMGVIDFGASGSGYVGMVGPHHITLRDIVISGSITSLSTGSGDHAVYFGQAIGGPHDILIDGLTVDGSGGVDTALHFYGSDGQYVNAWNITVRRLVVNGTRQAIELWDPTLHDIVIEDAAITGAELAVRYEMPGRDIVLRRITSTGSLSGMGFYSSFGASPPGVTFISNSFR